MRDRTTRDDMAPPACGRCEVRLTNVGYVIVEGAMANGVTGEVIGSDARDPFGNPTRTVVCMPCFKRFRGQPV